MPAGQASITNLYHTSIAWSMLTLAATQLASSFVHAAMGHERRDAELCRLMRRVAACAWVYPGLVLIHMSCVLHVRAFPDGSNFHAHWAAHGLFHANEEAMCLYLAQLVLLDVLLVAALIVLNDAPEPTSGALAPTRVAPDDRSLDAALGKAGEGASLLNGSAPLENGAYDPFEHAGHGKLVAQ